jgi:hypothetical protein
MTEYDSSYKEDMIFNMSLAMLKRIDLILTACAISSKQRDVGNWFNNLNVLRREVSYLFKGKEIDENKKHLFEVTTYYNTYVKYLEADKLKDFNNFGKFYNSLEEYERFLKSCLHERNMLAVKKEDLSKVMLR